MTPYVITVVMPWIEQGSCRFSGDRSFRLSYTTMTTSQRRGARSPSWIPSPPQYRPHRAGWLVSVHPCMPNTMRPARFSTPRPSRPVAFGSRREGRIRTDGLLLPKQARYQAAPLPDVPGSLACFT